MCRISEYRGPIMEDQMDDEMETGFAVGVYGGCRPENAQVSQVMAFALLQLRLKIVVVFRNILI